MTETLMRAADPARGLDPDPHSIEAREVMYRILATPRPARRRTPSKRRLALILTPAALVAAAVVALEAVGPQSSQHLTQTAYTVSVSSDGTAHVVIHWSELKDPAALQAALDKEGVPVRLLTGVTGAATPTDIPACAKPDVGGPYDRRAVQWDFPDRQSEVNGIIVRPRYFPRHGTFVLEAFYAPGSTHFASLLSFMTTQAPPRCAVPVGGPVATPTR